MTKKILTFILFFSCIKIYSQNIDKLLYTSQIYTYSYDDEYDLGQGLNCIYVDEVLSEVYLNRYYNSKMYVVTNNEFVEKDIQFWNPINDIYIFNNICISTVGTYIKIKCEAKEFSLKSGNGICFILRNNKKYIVFAVNEEGEPEAIDTEGKVYTNKEVFDFLKNYDPIKFYQSLEYATNLELKEKFINSEVLVWGNTYYSTSKKLKQFWKTKNDVFFKDYNTIQYDCNGNSYQSLFTSGEEYSEIMIRTPELSLLQSIKLHDYSLILQKHINNHDFSIINARMKVGFGGNIYFFVSDLTETEVFRIRRTWGEPELYAMAINGYTDDFYGKYVNTVLPTLSKADLRLLRNTIFALYGVHFKSADLSKYFDKQVWYTDEGKTSAEIQLPEHRQKLVEMIQNLEKK
jgi:hypothetical protein